MRIVFFTRLCFSQHGELARDNVAPHHSFGLDTALPDNLKYIEPGKVMYAAGNTLVILEVSTMKRRVIFGLDGGGIGAFAVHPTRTLVAVGEKGASPNIYVYEYPSFKIAKVSCWYSRVSKNLRMQTRQTVEFHHHRFTATGTYLAYCTLISGIGGQRHHLCSRFCLYATPARYAGHVTYGYPTVVG